MISHISAGEQAGFSQVDQITVDRRPVEPLIRQLREQVGMTHGSGRLLQALKDGNPGGGAA
jgi:hypothetical protein